MRNSNIQSSSLRYFRWHSIHPISSNNRFIFFLLLMPSSCHSLISHFAIFGRILILKIIYEISQSTTDILTTWTMGNDRKIAANHQRQTFNYSATVELIFIILIISADDKTWSSVIAIKAREKSSGDGRKSGNSLLFRYSTFSTIHCCWFAALLVRNFKFFKVPVPPLRVLRDKQNSSSAIRIDAVQIFHILITPF